MIKGKIFLVPITLGSDNFSQIIPEDVLEQTRRLSYFIVENERTARRFFSKIKMHRPIEEITLYPLNKHTDPNDVPGYLNAAKQGFDMGVISEAGVPAVADPGSEVVKLAHEFGLQVQPMVGPSSILLALMASGFNGQEFTFNGYLPIDQKDKATKIHSMEKAATIGGITQIFMDTPFRNNKMLDQLLETCHPETLLCIAADITLPTEYISTKKILQWKKQKPNLHKRPCMFLLGR